MSEIRRIICDICEKDVDRNDGEFVDAGVYGVHMHLSCLKNTGGLELMQVLGLDDIGIGPTGEKLIYSQHVVKKARK